MLLGEFERRKTFEDVSLKKRGVELKRLVTVLNHVLVELQLAVTEGSIAETNIHSYKSQSVTKYSSMKTNQSIMEI